MKDRIGATGFVYKNGADPLERLKNKLSVLFMTIENGKCNSKMTDEALKVMPEIIEHLENIIEFYKDEEKK